MNIGKNIKMYRKKRGLTQEQLAQLANLSKNAIYNYENNKRVPTFDILENIATALEIPTCLITRNTVDLTEFGLGTHKPNYDAIEKEYFPDDIVEHYKELLKRRSMLHMRDLACIILELKRDSLKLNKQIDEYENYLNELLHGYDYTLESFLNEVEKEIEEEEIIMNELKNDNSIDYK